MSACLLVLCALPSFAEIVDCVAVSVGDQVITQSQILDDIRVTAFLNNETPDFSSDARRDAADRLIAQLLIRREMESSGYPMPAQAEADAPEKALIARFGGEEAWNAALEKYGITRDQARQALWLQITTVRFIDYRFRPAVQAPRSAVQAEYDKHVAEWRARGEKNIPSFDEARSAMEQVVLEQRANQALDVWLGETRKQLSIIYHRSAFQ
ncbi:MAG TPA: hypothetical protein VFA04_14990 [Bryobacteraceae bacterium]|nr:hypothetical protein [Bryobacteraceae bacterium]